MLSAWHRRSPRTTSLLALFNQELRHLLELSVQSRLLASATGTFQSEVPHGGEPLVFETGSLALLADGSAVVRHGHNMVLTTAVSSREFDATRDFLPLQVDYKESMSAAGRIPETRTRREPAISERETLCARAIDRAIRPLFPPYFFYDTHVHATVMACDGRRDPEVLAINAASAALMCSDIPWGGPVGAVQVARVAGRLVVGPTRQQSQDADLKLTLAGTATHTVMIEALAKQVPEQVVGAAIELGQAEVVRLVEAQQKLAVQKGHSKREVALMAPTAQHVQLVQDLVGGHVSEVLSLPGLDKAARGSALDQVQQELLGRLRERGLLAQSDMQVPDGGMTQLQALFALDYVKKRVVRTMALDGATRVGGRKLTELRPISCAASVLPPCVHGSALFNRGETQAMCSATVASERERAASVSLLGPQKKSFLLHYNFPPASVNEVGKLSQPSRREIGHGALAEKALAPLMPASEDFPFVVRVTADTLMSNGSSSMAAVCGGSVALKDAGVPITDLAAGVSIGLVTERGPDMPGSILPSAPASNPYPWPQDYGRYALLSDIQGLEDHLGEMDFKIAGTRNGITALQLDVKLPGLPPSWLVEALQPAKAARLHVLDIMEDALEKAHGRSQNERPMRGATSINKELLSRLIGLDGENLLRLEEQTGAKVVVDESGVVEIYAPTQWQFAKAEALVKEVEGASIKEGQMYTVKVVSVLDFGAKVELANGVQCLLHINELSHFKIKDINEVVKEGMELKVKCIGRDEKGLIRLSRKAAMPLPAPGSRPPWEASEAPDRERERMVRAFDRQRSTRPTSPTEAGHRKPGLDIPAQQATSFSRDTSKSDEVHDHASRHDGRVIHGDDGRVVSPEGKPGQSAAAHGSHGRYDAHAHVAQAVPSQQGGWDVPVGGQVPVERNYAEPSSRNSGKHGRYGGYGGRDASSRHSSRDTDGSRGERDNAWGRQVDRDYALDRQAGNNGRRPRHNSSGASHAAEAAGRREDGTSNIASAHNDEPAAVDPGARADYTHQSSWLPPTPSKGFHEAKSNRQYAETARAALQAQRQDHRRRDGSNEVVSSQQNIEPSQLTDPNGYSSLDAWVDLSTQVEAERSPEHVPTARGPATTGASAFKDNVADNVGGTPRQDSTDTHVSGFGGTSTSAAVGSGQGVQGLEVARGATATGSSELETGSEYNERSKPASRGVKGSKRSK